MALRLDNSPDTIARLQSRAQQQGSPIVGETPSGTIDGANTIFDLANRAVDGSIKMYKTGVRVTNFTVSLTGTSPNQKTRITFAAAPAAGQTLLCDYYEI